MSSRASLKPAPPKPPTSIHPTAIIDPSAVLTGTHLITISAHTVLHPRSTLSSAHAPVSLGSYVVVEERAAITSPEAPFAGVSIGDYVLIEAGSKVEGCVKEESVVQVGGRIAKGAVIGEGCSLGPGTVIMEGEEVDGGVVAWGREGRERRVENIDTEVREAKKRARRRMIEGLRRLIPSNLAKWQ